MFDTLIRKDVTQWFKPIFHIEVAHEVIQYDSKHAATPKIRIATRVTDVDDRVTPDRNTNDL